LFVFNYQIQIKYAKELYVLKDTKHQKFKYDHAWEILKYHDKWVEPPSESSQANDLNSPLEGDEGTPTTGRNEVPASEGRPTGRNAAKTRRGITNEKDQIWREMMDSAAKTQELMEKQRLDNLVMNQKRVDLEQGKLDHKKKKLAMKQQ
jgi:hypothetical protein